MHEQIYCHMWKKSAGGFRKKARVRCLDWVIQNLPKQVSPMAMDTLYYISLPDRNDHQETVARDLSQRMEENEVVHRDVRHHHVIL